MVAKKTLFSRIVFGVVLIAVCGAIGFVLMRLNQAMEVRYQAVGLVLDEAGQPVEGVEGVLVLTPPPPLGSERDALFHRDALIRHRRGAGGQLKRSVGPVIGLSGARGGLLSVLQGGLVHLMPFAWGLIHPADLHSRWRGSCYTKKDTRTQP